LAGRRAEQPLSGTGAADATGQHRARRCSRREADCAPLFARGRCYTQGAGQTVFKKTWKICEPVQRAVMKELLLAETTSSAAIAVRFNFEFHATTVTTNLDLTR
jgi:hypothetical protein